MRAASREPDSQGRKGAPKQPPYRPNVPFPQRLAETRLTEQFAKFVEVLKQLHITIPFTDALTQIPTYAKFLKDILTNKRSLGERETVKLTEQCSAILSRELPPKLADPGKFSIPCTIGNATIQRALCDLGASVSLMPRSVYERLGIGELKPTRMTLQLADSSIRVPLGVIEDVPIQVGKFFVPGDFVVMEMEEDKDVPIILGRPFLSTARTLINMENGTITLRIGDEKVEYNLNRAMKCPDDPTTCCAFDMGDRSAKEKSCKQPILFSDYPDYLADSQVQEAVLKSLKAIRVADATPDNLDRLQRGPDGSHAGRVPPPEGLETTPCGSSEADARAPRGSSAPDADRVQTQTEPPTPELKPLLPPLRYEFPDPIKPCPVVSNADLDLDRNLNFLERLKAQQNVIGHLIWKLTGKNLNTFVPKSSPQHTDPAYQHTSRARAVWSPHSLHGCVEKTRWSLFRQRPPDPPFTNQ